MNNYNGHNDNSDSDPKNDHSSVNRCNRNRLKFFVIGIVVALIAFALYVSSMGDEQVLVESAKKALTVDAVYYPLQKVAVINYTDAMGAKIPVNVEVLGLSQSYRQTISGPTFTVYVNFDSEPKYGWAVNPVVIDMIHPEFGSVQLKTEIYETGDVKPRTIYAIHD